MSDFENISDSSSGPHVSKEPRFSLCITTMNRFDLFLSYFLDDYLQFKKDGVLDEIVVCDETGEDYQKIVQKYGADGPIRVYKNDYILGVYENKRNVVLKAKPGNFVALIDSDNFVGRDYFEVVRDYIIEHSLTPYMPFVLSPILCLPRFEFSYFNNFVIDGATAYNYIRNNEFLVFLNTGNFVTTRCVDELIQYKKVDIWNELDCIQKHLWCFQQIPEYRIHGVMNLSYFHNTHEGSYYANYGENPITEQRLETIKNAFRAFI